jgi:acyl-coenzyme A thioesterase PaaI-like protein
MNKSPTWKRWMNFWPPLLGAGIRVRHIADDFTAVDVEMRLRPWNQNAVGTHFGGSLYAMTDPFYMLMLMGALGRDYIVWDKAATIRFKKPGKGLVRAHFRLSQEQIASIRSEADQNHKVEPVLHVNVVDSDGVTVAEVEKTLYVRRKPPA